jgi:hypothetical protein
VTVLVTTKFFRGFGKAARTALVAAALTAGASPAIAQDDPNPGALTLTGSLDVLPGTAYVFRGITQETDPEITLWPALDVGIAALSGDGTIKTVGINFGVWNSLHTGSSGLDGPTEKLHYELDWYTTVALGFGGGYGLATTWTAYTSPNGMFGTTQELAFKFTKSYWLNPYATMAWEIDGAADGNDTGTGTYLELGVGPTWPLFDGKATVAVPVKMGLSLTNYYESPVTGEEGTFGFFDVGALVTLPFGGQPGRLGSWNFHVGADVLFLGDATADFNDGENTKFTAIIGLGFTY